MDLTLIFTITGIILSILIPLAGYFYKKNKELKNYYSLVWKSVSKLTPKDILGERPFSEIYFKRNSDQSLVESLKNKSNMLIVGSPLSGKTRAVYNLLKEHGNEFDILATRSVAMSTFEFPLNYQPSKDRVIFIDDFHNFIEKQDKYPFLFKIAREKKIPVIATCHSGKEFTKVRNKLIEQNMDIELIFGDRVFEIGKVDIDEGKLFAERLGVKWDNIMFNGTIGSIFMRLSEMERRYNQCDTIEKTILNVFRTLYICGVYEDNCVFKMAWVKKLSAGYELSGKDFEWTGWMKSLEGKEFIQLIKRDRVWAEDAYLEYIVKPEFGISVKELFEDVIEIFQNDPEALQMAGERAFDNGPAELNQSEYMKLSISAFKNVLKNVNAESNPAQFFKANYFIGKSYGSMARMENTKTNCVESIKFFNGITENSSLKLSPEDYALTKSSIGSSLNTLAGTENLENKTRHCKEAIDCFKEALSIYTINKYPTEYAQTNNNLGGVYLTLSSDEITTESLMNAAQCFKESLKIRTLENDPTGHAFTSLNLANTFATLSIIEEPEKNLMLALESYGKALRIYKKEKFPHQYGMVLNNIGNVYCLLAEVKDKRENVVKAKEYYEKAMEVRTIENTPIQFSNTIFNLADVQMVLYETDENTEHLYKAIEYFNDIIKMDVENIFLVRLGEIYASLGKIYLLIAKEEESKEKYMKGIEFYEKGIGIFSENNTLVLKEKSLKEFEKLKTAFNY